MQTQSTHSVAIIGASGYAGSELANLVQQHPHMELVGCYVSEHSTDAGKALSALYPRYKGRLEHKLQALTESAMAELKQQADVVFIGTEHEVAANLSMELLDAGCSVFDLSGAHRLTSTDDYEHYYGFKHPHPELLDQATYGLAEFAQEQLATADLVAVPGCYPTASLLTLKPIVPFLSQQQVIVNAVSGVTGAGRKPKTLTMGAELSLQGYGVFNHRHQPEIALHSQHDVLFTPHLGNFKRGILATIYATLQPNVDAEHIAQAYQCYKNAPCVRVGHGHQPAIKDVENTGYCDIGWFVQGQQLIAFAAIDNLLKGAASQALQCANIRLGYASTLGVPL